MNNYGLSESEEIFLTEGDCEACKIHERTIKTLLALLEQLHERIRELEKKETH